MARLIGNVTIDDEHYGPAHGRTEVGDGPDQVPADVAARITNPSAWDAPTEVVASPGDVDGGQPVSDVVDAPSGPAAPVDLTVMDRDQLAAFIEGRGGKVDQRFGEDKLREVAAALPDAEG